MILKLKQRQSAFGRIFGQQKIWQTPQMSSHVLVIYYFSFILSQGIYNRAWYVHRSEEWVG